MTSKIATLINEFRQGEESEEARIERLKGEHNDAIPALVRDAVAELFGEYWPELESHSKAIAYRNDQGWVTSATVEIKAPDLSPVEVYVDTYTTVEMDNGGNNSVPWVPKRAVEQNLIATSAVPEKVKVWMKRPGEGTGTLYNFVSGRREYWGNAAEDVIVTASQHYQAWVEEEALRKERQAEKERQEQQQAEHEAKKARARDILSKIEAGGLTDEQFDTLVDEYEALGEYKALGARIAYHDADGLREHRAEKKRKAEHIQRRNDEAKAAHAKIDAWAEEARQVYRQIVEYINKIELREGKQEVTTTEIHYGITGDEGQANGCNVTCLGTEPTPEGYWRVVSYGEVTHRKYMTIYAVDAPRTTTIENNSRVAHSFTVTAEISVNGYGRSVLWRSINVHPDRAAMVEAEIAEAIAQKPLPELVVEAEYMSDRSIADLAEKALRLHEEQGQDAD